MINISIERNGEITISQETAEERISLSKHYDSYKPFEDAYGEATEGEKSEDPRSEETKKDEERAAFFKQGWEMCAREAQLSFVNGRIIEFFQEQGVEAGSEDPHSAEPEGTGEEQEVDVEIGVDDDLPAAGWREPGWADTPIGRQIQDNIARENEARHASNEIGLAVIRPVEDSGEPELESEPVDDVEPGTWTMSNDELHSRLDTARREGLERGLNTPKHTTQRALDIIAVEINNQLLQAWTEEQSSEEAVSGDVLTKGEYARRFSAILAKRLGYEVSA